MVSDLNFESHPGKPLEKHIRRVLQGTLHNFSSPIAELAALFHDMGKINPNFQQKLYGKTAGYNNHSYLSVIAFINYALSNPSEIKEKAGINTNKDLALFIFQVSILIAKHHQHLPNFDLAFSASEELENAITFALKENHHFPVSAFLKEKMKINSKPFDLNFNKRNKGFLSFSNKYHVPAWKKNPLKYFLDTQMGFAALIESDKRDAGNNKDYNFKESVKQNTFQLRNSLEEKFIEFDAVRSGSSLNELRTNIRLEAIKGTREGLKRKEHIFTLTAPTGAGKTFTLLAIADEIRKQKGVLGIIYTLPFLSITEQVQTIAKNLLDDVLSVNSKAENHRIDIAQENYETDQSQDNLFRVLREDFIANTFDHPFIITTFVQFFETLVSNRNSTLLKLPNFANRILLIDEIQALPPRLYIFFSAWLDAFCKRNNSFAVLSTATMPNFEIPKKEYLDLDKRADLLFNEYVVPKDLIHSRKYFDEDIFNRYKINVIQESLDSISLSKLLLSEKQSCLVILNTIDDTKELYNLLTEETANILLLNTHFIPDDRTRIIEEAKTLLNSGEKVYLISTQLIEAGVDIDFPIVYRDLCPLPSLIQSAGRCNRNKKIPMGQVMFFQLVNEEGSSRANLIYRNEAKHFLDFCKTNISSDIEENNLFDVQSKFFDSIKENLSIGDFYPSKYHSENMIECVNNARFETLGRFKLITEEIGIQQQYYISKNENDDTSEVLSSLLEDLRACDNYAASKIIKIKINSLIKSISGRILNIRVNNFNKDQVPQVFDAEILGIKFISKDYYSKTTGLKVGNSENCFL
ncbi:CRISPR-associated helicase Cas3' [Marinilabilia sp.]|uniref:CRISPR-associated helicase Cas3' n=1 Tax=Marinilabilia sp. TaxID=2021252 RepID=UPI0025C6D926|nr:CRISPR-associated helicase Cas3' [Marinilabilia sp.]